MEPVPGESPAPPNPLPGDQRGQAPRVPVGSTKDTIAAVIVGVTYLLFQSVVLRLHITNVLLLDAISIVSLLITLVFTVRAARALRTPAMQVGSLLIFTAILAPFLLLPFLPITRPHDILIARRVYLGYRMVFDRIPGLNGLLLMCLAVSLGVVLSRLVREVKLLLPVGVVLALVDLYVVFGGGLVTQANSGKAPAAQIAMRTLTVPLTPRMPKQMHAPTPVAVGFADFLFIALFFACFARFGMPSRRTFLLLCGVLSFYLLAVLVAKWDLPALVPIAVVVIGSNLRAFHYRREEAFALLYAGILVIGILGALVVLGRR